jgi:hypothetical protein
MNRNPFAKLMLLSILIVFGLTSCFLHKREKPSDYEISGDFLKQKLTNSAGNSIYDSILQRFLNFDSSLVEQDYKLLYYGQTTLSGFSGYFSSNLSEARENISNKQLIDAEKRLDSMLLNHPIDLACNFYKSYVESLIDKNAPITHKLINRMNKLYDAILSTGDGKDRENAIDVVHVSDEYFICYYILYTGDVTGQSLIEDKGRVYDVLTVEKSKNYNKEQVWFDITLFFGKF